MSVADELLLRGSTLQQLLSEDSSPAYLSQIDSDNVDYLPDEVPNRFKDEDAEDNHHFGGLSPAAAMRKSRSAVSSHRTSQKLSAHTDDLEGTSENRRPYTAATSSPSEFNTVVNVKKKKSPSAAKKSSSASVESANITNTTQRPLSAGLDGWGDFDADRLLEDDSTVSNPIDEAEELIDGSEAHVLADPEPERPRPRRNWHSASATTIHNPAEDFPAMPQATESARLKASKEQPPRPVTHVLRQRPLAVVDFSATSSWRLNSKSSVEKMGRLSGLRGRVQPPTGGGPPPSPSLQQQCNRLPRIGGQGIQQQIGLQQLQAAPLFGASLPDSQEMRAQIFDRFRHLWSLMSSRSSSACTASSSLELSLYPGDESTVAAASLQQCKSPFECSMTLMKICKSIGISFSSSASTSSLSIWSSKERDVDFVSFCDFVIRIAIQPALEHFQKDSSVDEYISTIDLILENVIATSLSLALEDEHPQPEEYRVKELAEIRSLFPQWKVGVTPLGKSRPGTKANTSNCSNSVGGFKALNPATDLQDEKSGQQLPSPNFLSRREFTFQLPAEEARAVHSENVRRKVQLHKSWQPRSTLRNNVSFSNIAVLNAVSDSSVASHVPSSASVSHSSPMKTNGVNHHHPDHGVMAPNGLLLGCATSVPLYPKRCDAGANQDNHHQESGTAAASDDDRDLKESLSGHETSSSLEEADNLEKENHEDPAQHDEEQVLICGECTVSEAVLWCSSCFSVYCVDCWQTLHLLSVDISGLCGHSSSSSSSATVLAPTAKPLKPYGTGNNNSNNNNNNSPPLAMIYLPTKPLATGKIAKGACSKWKPCENDEGNPISQAAPTVPAKQILTESHALLTVSSHSILPLLPNTQPLKALGKKNNPMSAFKSTSNMVKTLMLGSASSASLALSSVATSTTTSAAQMPRKYVDPKKRTKLHPVSVLLDPTQVFADSTIMGEPLCGRR